MPKSMIKLVAQRRSGEKWGLSVNGGKDQSLTAKVGKVKVFSPVVTKTVTSAEYAQFNTQEMKQFMFMR